MEDESEYRVTKASTRNVERTASRDSSPANGSVSAGAAASGGAAGSSLGSFKQRDRDYSPPTPYYQDAFSTIYHGDCREIMAAMDEKSVDLVLSDPPYGVAFRYAGKYDDSDVRGYCAMMGEAIDGMRRVGKCLMVTTGMRNMWMWPPPTWMLCWAKPGSTRRSDLGGFNEWEPVLVYGKRKIYNDFRLLPDCANHSKSHGGHPCPKPEKLLTWLVEQGCDAGGSVLDPFAGSGTTLRAAKDLGRKAIGIEVEERYCEIIARRLQQEVLDFAENGAGVAGSSGSSGATRADNHESALPEASQRQNDGDQRQIPAGKASQE